MAVDILVPLSVFLTIFGIVYVIFTTRHRERMAMIERGTDPSLFTQAISNKGNAIKAGMFIVGAGLGIIIGSTARKFGLLDKGLAEVAMVLIFAGGALVWSHFVVKKLDDKGDL